MRQGLREITGELPACRVVLLGEQANVVAERQQPFEQVPGLVAVSGGSEVVGEPEGAGDEGILILIEPVTAPWARAE